MFALTALCYGMLCCFVLRLFYGVYVLVRLHVASTYNCHLQRRWVCMSTVPTATILGGPDLHVDKSSTINLTCTVKFSPEPPAYIFWYHHEENFLSLLRRSVKESETNFLTKSTSKGWQENKRLLSHRTPSQWETHFVIIYENPFQEEEKEND
uniref:Ig-like domain-containing protein n=1 Tax=Glossina austeni TaxID=7395 RepID=A0A1A9URS6_GLOAU